MKRNTVIGLVILAVVVFVTAVLWRLYLSGPPQAGPGPMATAKPSVAPAPTLAPPLATPETKQLPQPAAPSTPPITTQPPQGVAPLQEPSSGAPKMTVLPPQEMEEHYGIMVGSYRNYQDAAKLLAKLKKQGKPAFVQRDPKDPNLFQVWLGPFSSQIKAQAAEKELHAKLKKPFKIEQIENPVPK